MTSRIAPYLGSLCGLLTIQLGCAGVPPTLTNALVAFGAELIGKASVNYTDDYAHSVNQILLAVAESATGQPFTQQQQYAIHESLSRQQAGGDQNGGYDDNQGPYEGDGDQYEGYDNAHDGPRDQSGTYGQPGSGDGYGTYDTQPGSNGTSYGTSPVPTDEYGYSQQPAMSMAAPTLEVALLAQTLRSDGRVTLRPVQDGDVLRDGGNNPSLGDKLKLSFRTTCNCYLYILGVDATGWITRIRPEPFQQSVPVTANQLYLIPPGVEWWGLDSYKGVEHIYFVLSRIRRTDLEQALERLPAQRPAPRRNYQPVVQPALVSTRGLVKVTAAAPESVPISIGVNQTVQPDAFTSQFATADLVVTRWFQHE